MLKLHYGKTGSLLSDQARYRLQNSSGKNIPGSLMLPGMCYKKD